MNKFPRNSHYWILGTMGLVTILSGLVRNTVTNAVEQQANLFSPKNSVSVSLVGDYSGQATLQASTTAC